LVGNWFSALATAEDVHISFLYFFFTSHNREQGNQILFLTAERHAAQQALIDFMRQTLGSKFDWARVWRARVSEWVLWLHTRRTGVRFTVGTKTFHYPTASTLAVGLNHSPLQWLPM
jgi:hypothetical protein